MAKYKIISYNEVTDTHKLVDENGKSFDVDLFVDASFENYPSAYFSETTGESRKDACKEIIGKTVEVGELVPYTLIGQNVKLID